MADLTRDERRINRKHVLDALVQETGGFGGGPAEPRVKAYRTDPTGASTIEFAFVGALMLRRFYIDPSKPNAVELSRLWENVRKRMDKPSVPAPGGVDGTTRVMGLQATAEEA
jgi:hypothetical protein